MRLRTVGLKIPGTCGEWIQTVYEGRECLVSLPINRYTTVTLTLTDTETALASQAILLPKSRQALSLAGTYCGMTDQALNQVAVTIARELEIGKGMASSTADLYGIMLGLVKLQGMQVSIPDLFKLCCQIEASDGIMFDQWTLVDQLNGIVLESFENSPNVELLMLTPAGVVETESLRGHGGYAEKLLNKTGKPLELFKEALATSDLSLLGKAATCSLLENESVLEKAHLEALIQIAETFNCFGVVGGHSGTVSGLMLNPLLTDKRALIDELKQLPVGAYYKDYQFVSTVKGGAELVFAEA